MSMTLKEAAALLHNPPADAADHAAEAIAITVEGLLEMANGRGMPADLDAVQEAALMGAASVTARTLHKVMQSMQDHGPDAYLAAGSTVALLMDSFVVILSMTVEAQMPGQHQIAAPAAGAPTLH